jgi:DUF2934 family protein
MRRRSTSAPIPKETELQTLDRDERIRTRAYALYEARGRVDGHDVDDWLQAEAELRGKSKTAVA